MRKDLSMRVVEVSGAFASKFKVLVLVLSDRHVSSSISGIALAPQSNDQRAYPWTIDGQDWCHVGRAN